MVRHDIVNAIIKLHIPWNSDVSVMEVADVMSEYMKEVKQTANKIKWKLDDGVLYGNGKALRRVGSKAPRYEYSENAAYWEGRILERQEAWMD